jgi:hypothetical protein
MVNRKFSLILVCFLVMGLVGSCATTMNQKITYLTARDSFNGALKNYMERVRAMPDGADKEAVKADFNPVWKDAEKSLDAWGGVVKGGSTQDPAEAVMHFTQAKNALIELGLKYFGDRLFSE